MERGRRFDIDPVHGEPDAAVLASKPSQPARAARIVAVVVLLLQGVLRGTPALAYQGAASAGWGLRLDDHRAQGSDRFTPWTQVLVPELGFVGEPCRTRLQATAGGRIEVGTPVPGEGLGPLRRGSSGAARVALSHTIAPGAAVDAQGFAERSHDLLDDDQASVTASADELRWGASAAGAVRWAEGEYRLRGWRSEATRAESRSLAWGARAILLHLAPGELFAGAHERRLESDREPVLNARVASLGLRRALAPGLTATLELGAIDEQLGLVREPSRAAGSLELATASGSAPTDIRLRVARELGNEFALELGRSAGSARAWLQGSSGVDIEGAGASTPAVIDRAAFGVDDTLGGATVLGVRASFARERAYRGLPHARTAATRLGAFLARRIQPWLTCRAGWDLLERTGDGTVPSSRRSRLELLLRAETR